MVLSMGRGVSSNLFYHFWVVKMQRWLLGYMGIGHLQDFVIQAWYVVSPIPKHGKYIDVTFAGTNIVSIILYTEPR
jgi:hypothetical protein